MKIIALSDLHGNLISIEQPFDIMLIAGDIVKLDYQRSKDFSEEWFTHEFVDWINSLPFNDENSKVYWIAGNHEVGFYDSGLENRDKIGNDVYNLTNGRCKYLEDDLVDHLGVKIYGSPWCKRFGRRWAFNASDSDLYDHFKQIPSNIDILLTHDAPYGTSDLCYGWLDWGRNPEHIGNEPLRDAILEKHPKINIHGHLHTANHDFEYLDDTLVYNVSILDENYKIVYNPLIFDFNEN